MAKRYYIAYGSNLNIPQMRWRCPSARIIGTSEIPDYRLLFKGSHGMHMEKILQAFMQED